MKQTDLAHRSEDGREQSVSQHLHGTARLCAQFAASFGAEQAGELCGLAHDLGKYSDEFQQRIRGSLNHVDHSTAGAGICALDCHHLPAAFAVAGHHGSLPDGGFQTDPDYNATFSARIKRYIAHKIPIFDRWRNEITLPQLPPFSPTNIDPDDPIRSSLFFTRMLYSCLIDADRLDTAAFMNGQTESPAHLSIEQLWERLEAYIRPWFPPKGVLNTQRCAVLKQCIDQGQSCTPGLFSLTVPTGGGKTVASLAFALAHAKAHGLRRVIYVIPYTSIIEQTAQTFREILGDESVLEHHSNVLSDLKEEETVREIRLAQATENWDIPVVVTTAVQFFESLHACRSSKCRKLHNISQSVIIFDEAQMLPVSYLLPCVWAIAQLVKNYQVSAVLCTATQPALDRYFEKFLPGIPVRELCPPQVYEQAIFRRTTYRNAGRLTQNELIHQLNKSEQVLCIVNSRKSAQEIFAGLEGDGSFHLSTLMAPAHRQDQLALIRRRLTQGLSCRVVSTSLIEAGVDVDFPSVWRELAGLDSILQAGGRCNREGRRPAVESLVTIFQGEDPAPPLFSTAIDVARQILNGKDSYDRLDDPETIRAYFQNLLFFKGEDALDIQKILALTKKGSMPFREIAKRFHLIDSPTKTVYVPYKDGAGLIREFDRGVRDRTLFRQLGRYSVSVYARHFDTLVQAGDIEVIQEDLAILRNETLYSEKTGLSLDADFGKSLFI